ncbi:hypothetical protein LJ655_10910 [Paraburkholderia sp. MMS20-SJTN17]|uniref:Uncharacterized protein n=1 Tax=Paraburkholderia translucens TaxID=2886945 RepID=A0ABS8KCA0_9BURK|nr:hypothetical protein [Paraburkholderia sp. MMS20-SJTN17]MCC8402396.1 hypothetical protein [Paraburkholderia sp. MMS20-SJTN17]
MKTTDTMPDLQSVRPANSQIRFSLALIRGTRPATRHHRILLHGLRRVAAQRVHHTSIGIADALPARLAHPYVLPRSADRTDRTEPMISA